MSEDLNAGRRHFIIGAVVIGAGTAGGLYLAGRRPENGGSSGAAGRTLAPNVWLRIAPDDTVTLASGKAEMGQGFMTGAAIALGEELDIDPARIKVEFAGVDKAYYHPFLPAQFTGGSNSTQTVHEVLRVTGARARAALLAAAARRWGADVAELRTDNGMVHYGRRKLSYGQLADAAVDEPLPEKPVLKDASQFKYIGKTHHRHDSRDKVTGRARFGLDVDLPDMLVAMVAHAPVFGGRVKSFDDRAARQIAGVVDVKQIPTGVAVLATNTWAARRGRDALLVDWDLGPMARFTIDGLRANYRARLLSPGPSARNDGDALQALRTAKGRSIDVEYETPYLAHATMEPMNCCIHARADSAEVWVGTQNHSQDAAEIAKVLELTPEQVTLHVQYLGGGFGRRASTKSDYVVEAAHIAKGAGRPVKMVWTREDDMRAGFYRPYALTRIRAALDADGKLVAWHFNNVSQPVLLSSAFATLARQPDGRDVSSSEGSANFPYAVPNVRVDSINGEAGVPILWWRSVANSFNAFAVNAAIDELATLAGVDTYQFRRSMLGQQPRHRAVLDKAAEMANWGKLLAEGHHHGIALQESFGSIVAQVAEVSVTAGEVKVHKVHCAVDCGTAINPGQVAAQMESGIIYGLSAALWGEIEFENGRVRQSNFDDYRVVRMSESPAIEVAIINSGAALGGIGEPGTPPIAPAVCGAIFAATGKRIRRLPIARA